MFFRTSMTVPPKTKGTWSTAATIPTTSAVSIRMPRTRQKSPVTRRHERRRASIGPLPSSTTAAGANAKRVLKNST